MSVKILGMNSLIRKLNQLGGNAENVLFHSVKECTVFVKDDARLRCLEDTGELRRSINCSTKKEKSKIIGTVGTNKEYAAYVEFGTGQRGQATNTQQNISYSQEWVGRKAQPFLYPALKDNETQISNKIKNDLQKEVRRLTK